LKAIIRKKLLEYLEEDLATGNALRIPDKAIRAEIVSKDEGVVAGVEVLRILFDLVGVDAVAEVEDGSKVRRGDVVIRVDGNAKEIFEVERTALNILMRMSGIATTVAKMVEKARRVNPNVIIAGTRKTTPGFRLFEKMAIEIGGGDPHRYSLGDCVIVKRNLIRIFGLEKAIEFAKTSFTKKVEVEVKTVDEAVKVAEMNVDIIMFDNMSVEEVESAVRELEKRSLRDRVLLEASGGITPDNVECYAKTGVDVISSGYITHSSKWLDFSLRVI